MTERFIQFAKAITDKVPRYSGLQFNLDCNPFLLSSKIGGIEGQLYTPTTLPQNFEEETALLDILAELILPMHQEAIRIFPNYWPQVCTVFASFITYLYTSCYSSYFATYLIKGNYLTDDGYNAYHEWTELVSKHTGVTYIVDFSSVQFHTDMMLPEVRDNGVTVYSFRALKEQVAQLQPVTTLFPNPLVNLDEYSCSKWIPCLRFQYKVKPINI